MIRGIPHTLKLAILFLAVIAVFSSAQNIAHAESDSVKLISPANGATVQPGEKIVFKWEDYKVPQGTLYYYFYLEKNGTQVFEPKIIQIGKKPARIEWTAEEEGDYSWHVIVCKYRRPRMPVAKSENCKFVVSKKATVFLMLFPDTSSTSPQKSVKFAWTKATGAVSYRLFIDKMPPRKLSLSDISVSTQNGVEVCSYTLDVSKWESGSHSWYLKAVMPNGTLVSPNNSSEKKWGFFTEKKPSAGPVLAQPSNMAKFVEGSRITFVWSFSAKADSFEFYLNGQKIGDVSGSSNRFDWTARSAGEYRWKVRAKISGKFSMFSSERTVSILKKLQDFQLISPDDKSFLEGEVLLAWTVPKNATSFLLNIDSKKIDLPISILKVTFLKGKRVYTYKPSGIAKGSHKWSVVANALGGQKKNPTNVRNSWEFTVVGKLMPPKNLRTKSGKTVFIAGSDISFLWNPSVGATSYDISINNTKMTPNNRDKSLTTFTWRPEKAGKYSIVVTSVLGSIKRTSKALSFTVVPRIGDFRLLSPLNNAAVSEKITLKWTVAANARGYDVFLNGRVFDKNIRPTDDNGTLSYRLKKSDIIKGSNQWNIKALGDLNQVKESSNASQGSFKYSKLVLPPTSFRLISPLNSVIVADKLILSWQESQNSLSYKILINGKTYRDNLVVVAKRGICTLEVSSSELKSGKNYWSVEAIAAKGASVKASNANLGTFVFSITPKSFSMISPIANVAISGSVQLKWRVSPNAVAYKILLDGKVISSHLLTTPVNQICSFSLTKSIKPGKHVWKVLALSGSGKEIPATNQNAGSFRYLVKPEKFSLISPLNRPMFDADVILKWQASKFAIAYRIIIDGKIIENRLIVAPLNNVCSFNVPMNNLSYGNHEWRVIALGESNLETEASNSSSGSFGLIAAPSAFKLVSPINDSEIVGKVELKWETAKNCSSYKIIFDGRILEREFRALSVKGYCYYQISTVIQGKHTWSVFAKNSLKREVEASNSESGRFSFVKLPGTFSLISPIAGASIKGGVELKWASSPNTKFYAISLDGKEVSSKFMATPVNGVCTLAFKGNEVSAGKHTWKVFAISGGKRIPASNNAQGSFEFVVSPASFSLVYPINRVTIEGKFEFKWTSSRGAELYVLYIDGKIIANIYKPLDNSTTCSHPYDTSKLKDGIHSWYVKAANEWEETDPTNIAAGSFTLLIPPAKFKLIRPIDGEILTEKITLKWGKSIHAIYYKVFLDNVLVSSRFVPVASDDSCVFDVDKKLFRAGEHTWKVVAYNDSSKSTEAENSSSGRFVFRISPGIFSLVSPLDGKIVQDEVVLIWTQSQNAKGYSVILDGKEIESNINPVLSGGKCRYKIQKSKITQGSHTWKIVALNGQQRIYASNNSSGKFSFSVAPSGFALLSPINRDIVEGECVLQWKLAANATSYNILFNGVSIAKDYKPVPINRICSYKVETRFLKKGQNTWAIEALGVANLKIPASNNSSGIFDYSFVPASFSLISPVNDMRVQDTIVLRWSVSEHATSYRIRINGKWLNSPKQPTIRQNVCSLEISGDLFTAGKNTWTVFSVSTKGTETEATNGSIGRFELAFSPRSFSLVSPINGQKCPASVVLKWAVSANAIQYRILLDGKTIENAFVTVPTNGICSYGLRDLTQGKHSWNVQAIGEGNTASNPDNQSQGNFFCVLPLVDFKLLHPLSVRFEAPYELKWSLSKNAVSYSIFLDGKEIASQIRPKITNGTVCSYSFDVSNLTQGEHLWNVYANNADGSNLCASNSREGVFNFFKNISSFKLLSPINNESVYESLVLTWEAARNVKSYSVTLNGKQLADKVVISKGVASVSLSGYLPTGTYSWSVVARGEGDQQRPAVNNSQGKFTIKKKAIPSLTPTQRVSHPLSEFSLISPISGKTVSGNIVLQWEDSLNSVNYEVFVNGSHAFTGTPEKKRNKNGKYYCYFVVEESMLVVGENTWVVSALSKESQRKEAKNNSIGRFTFATSLEPSPFMLLSPLSKSVVNNPVRFVWEKSSEAVGYKLIIDDQEIPLKSHEIEVSNQLDGTEICSVFVTVSPGEHTWKVKSSEGIEALNSSDGVFKVLLFTPVVIGGIIGFLTLLCLLLILMFSVKSAGKPRFKQVASSSDASNSENQGEARAAMNRELQAVVKHINSKLDNLEASLCVLSGDSKTTPTSDLQDGIKSFKNDFDETRKTLEKLSDKVEALSKKRSR